MTPVTAVWRRKRHGPGGFVIVAGGTHGLAGAGHEKGR